MGLTPHREAKEASELRRGAQGCSLQGNHKFLVEWLRSQMVGSYAVAVYQRWGYGTSESLAQLARRSGGHPPPRSCISLLS